MPDEKRVQRPVLLSVESAALVYAVLCEKYGRDALFAGADAIRAIEAAAEPEPRPAMPEAS